MTKNPKFLEQLGKVKKELERLEQLLLKEVNEAPEGGGEMVEIGGENYERVGVFDGQFMVAENGKRYQVPPNYASKSRLVVGDQLALLGELKEGDQNQFKQLDKVSRLETEGVLTKKDNQWAVVTDVGEFWVLPASVQYYEGEIGDKVKLLLPADIGGRKDVAWAAVDEVIKDADGRQSSMTDQGSKVEELGATQGLSGEVVLGGEEVDELGKELLSFGKSEAGSQPTVRSEDQQEVEELR